MSDKPTKSAARALIRERLAQVKASLAEAQRIADEAGIDFDLNVGGSHAGTYYGKGCEAGADYLDDHERAGGWHGAWDSSWC